MKYQVIKYPDGSFYTQIIEFSNKLTFRINSYEDLWILRQIKDVCNHNNQKVDLTIPCLLDAQADRRFNKNESSGLKLVCKFINDLNFQSVSVFHPHNQEVVEALIDNVKIIHNDILINSILDYTGYNLCLLSTDAGGYKPLVKLADNIKWDDMVFSASKSRKYSNGKSVLTQEISINDFEGKNILIIDDLCVNGGTFIGLSKLLKERNCGKIYLMVSHLTIENPNPLLFDSFEMVFTTNSKGFKFGNKPKNLVVVNLFK